MNDIDPVLYWAAGLALVGYIIVGLIAVLLARKFWRWLWR